MSPVGPLKPKRVPEPVRRQIEVAAAGAWEALVEAHGEHALRFVTLLAGRVPFDEALSRYLSEMDLRDPMASSVRSRVLIALEEARGRATSPPPEPPEPGEPGEPVVPDVPDGASDDGLRRFRPDILMKGIARKYREAEEMEQWISLSIARAEEAVIQVHIENAVRFAAILDKQSSLNEAVEDYIELLRITGGRAQAVYQRTMARLADLHLPAAQARTAPIES